MKKKICLVTGANSGIGFELALGMANNNYETILLCRNKTSGEVAKNIIIKESKNQNVHLMIADLSSQQSIRKFANEFHAKYDHLDALFNNAGANFFERQKSADGIEMTFAVNYLSSFLLTNLLLPKLKESDSGKIIFTVGSISDKAVIQFNDINFENKYSVVNATAQSLLAKFLFCYEFDRRLNGSSVTVNCFHPGATKTDLQKKMPLAWKILIGIMRPFFHSAAKGAETGLHLALANEIENISGRYFKNLKEQKSPKLANDKEVAIQLWEESEKLVNEKFNFKKMNKNGK